jgi:FkbM family methyltransferase
MNNIKSIIYKTGINALRMFWRVRGRRTIKAFNEEYNVTADTIFPNYRKFKLPKGGYLSEIVRYTDYVQLHSVVNYVSQLKNHPSIIDIGAHHGAYAVILGKIVQKKGGMIIGVEPNPQSFEVLQKNVILNKLENTVVCEHVAIADKEGNMNLESIGSQSRLTLSNSDYVIEVITLEKLLIKHKINYVNLLLIDVEGAELLVLNGFPWQSVNVGKIFCELHPYAWKDFGYSGVDMSKFMSEHDYRCFDMFLQEHKIFDRDAYIGPTFLWNAE